MEKREASFGPNLLKPVAGDRQESPPAASTVAVLAGVVVASSGGEDYLDELDDDFG